MNLHSLDTSLQPIPLTSRIFAQLDRYDTPHGVLTDMYYDTAHQQVRGIWTDNKDGRAYLIYVEEYSDPHYIDTFGEDDYRREPMDWSLYHTHILEGDA